MADPTFAWPGGARGAVSLSFDDGMASHLALAIPALDAVGLKGTFYVNPSPERWPQSAAPWQAAHQAGHEIGNHTVRHPCCLNTVGARGLVSWTLEEIEADVLAAQALLDAALTPPRPRSFAYPCYETDVGHGGARRSYVPVIARHFVAARARGLVKHRPNHPLYADLHCLSCLPMEDADSHRLLGAAQTAAEEGGWVILVFHGIDEGHLPTALVHLQRLLAFLDRERDRLWTAPVIEVGAYLARARA